MATIKRNQAQSSGACGQVGVRWRSAFSRTALVWGLYATAGVGLMSPEAVKAQDAATQNTETESTEIVVTAQRREELARNVAGGLQVYSGAELDRVGADQFADYLLSVPGLSLRGQGNGSQRIAIRGVSNIAGGDYVVGDPASTVGLYLNDIALAGTAILPDLQLYDLNRVEVLKGPQGTLYGEGAMGGAIKMILNKPDLLAFAARGEATLSNTEHGGTNYAARGMVNIPIVNDRVGLRLVGTYKSNAGFIDNIATGKKNQNDDESWSGRAILEARLTDRFSAEILVLRDVLDQSEFPQVSNRLGDLQIDVVEPRFNKSKVWVGGLTLNYDLDFATVTSVSSYFELDRVFLDTVPFLGATFTGFFGVPAGLYTQESFQAGSITRSIGQEVRIVSNENKPLDWVVGGYYRKKKFDADSFVPIPQNELGPINAALVANGFAPFPGPRGYERHVNDTYEHLAFYGEANLEIAPRLELIAGLRWFRETIKDEEFSVGFGPIAFYSSPVARRSIEESGVVPKFALRYKPNDATMLYAQAAKGFRSPLYNIQRAFGVGDDGATSDNLWNFEAGVKSRVADGRLSLEASVFHIDWKDIQLTLVDFSPIINFPVGYVENGGHAKITGFEFAIAASPIPQLHVGLNGSYMNARMARGDLDVLSGKVLPNAPEWTLSGEVEYRTPVSSSLDFFARFDAQFVDTQATKAITTTNTGEFLQSYTMGNLRIGLETQDSWGVSLFVENLWDERAQYGVGIASPNPTINPDRFTIARPRTIGVTVRSAF